MKTNKPLDLADRELLRTTRHQMHVTDDIGEWFRGLDTMKEISKELNEKLPKLDIIDVETCDDFECMGDCEICKEHEKEYLDHWREKVNEIIEKWMREYDMEMEDVEDALAPSGWARLRWIESA